MRMQRQDIKKFRKASRKITEAFEVFSDLANKYGHQWYFVNDDAYPFMDASILDVSYSCQEWTTEIQKTLKEWPKHPRRQRQKTE